MYKLIHAGHQIQIAGGRPTPWSNLFCGAHHRPSREKTISRYNILVKHKNIILSEGFSHLRLLHHSQEAVRGM